MRAIHDSEFHFVKQGRAELRDEIVIDLEKRLSILRDSIANPKHTFRERTTLMVLERAFEVLRTEYGKMS